MKTFLKGALVYLPSGAKLYQLSEGAAVLRYKTIPKPMNVLYTGQHEKGYFTVLYDGEAWYVPVGDVYPTINKRKGENEC